LIKLVVARWKVTQMNGRIALLTLVLGTVCYTATIAETDTAASINFSGIRSPIILRGDDKTAYRDPAAVYHDGTFYLFFTLVRTDEDGRIYSYTATSTSRDLRNFSKPKIITPKGQHLNFSSPGNVVRFKGEWILCLQTYPRLDYRRDGKLRWADQTARIFIMRSRDLIHWGEAELLRVKGPDVPREQMGRMIDPYLIEDKDEPGKWWCFYKQRGVSLSWSRDLKNWTNFARADSGENVCALIDGDEYVLFHSPGNGIGVKRSKDLKNWRDVDGLITLGQQDWPWAQTRLTAGVVLDLRKDSRFGKCVMFYHAGGPGKSKTQDNCDANCSLGIAWSDDLKTWEWPGRANAKLSFSDIWGDLPSAKGGHGAMWADADNDGRADLYLPLITQFEKGGRADLFLHNKGGGVFAEDADAHHIDDRDGGSHGAAWADLDNDGDFDLINGTTSQKENINLPASNNIFRNDGNGFFVDITPDSVRARKEGTRAFLAFDMDKDGDLDLLGISGPYGSGDAPSERNEIWRNDGNFRFTEITSGALYIAPAGQGATDTDYDGDGDIDIFAANRNGDVNILRNDGKGDFTLVWPSSVGISHRAEDGISTADIDNDGDLDLLLAGDNYGRLYLNDGDGTFTFKESFSETDGYMGGFADLDNDGDLDLVFAGDRLCRLNDGSGNFSAGAAAPNSGLNDPRGIGFADIDNDGDMDFAVGAKRSRCAIIRNNFNSGNWLKIRLVSPGGQAGAFGAKTRIYPAGQAGGDLLGLRESKSNYGYLGQDSPILHFGLGRHCEVDVVVTFLDGSAAARTNVAANQTITISGKLNRL